MDLQEIINMDTRLFPFLFHSSISPRSLQSYSTHHQLWINIFHEGIEVGQRLYFWNRMPVSNGYISIPSNHWCKIVIIIQRTRALVIEI